LLNIENSILIAALSLDKSDALLQSKFEKLKGRRSVLDKRGCQERAGGRFLSEGRRVRASNGPEGAPLIARDAIHAVPKLISVFCLSQKN
jgi:hypothetical protein